MCETTAFFVNEATTQIELNFSSLTPGLLKRCDIQNKGTWTMDVLREALGSEELAHPAAIAGISFPELLFFHWHGMQGPANLKKRNIPGPKSLPFIENFFETMKFIGMHLMYLEMKLKSSVKFSPFVWEKNQP